jgi:hypothetical protein
MLLIESKEPLPAGPIGSVVVASPEATPPRACPHCGKPGLVLVRRLMPTRYLPPIRQSAPGPP